MKWAPIGASITPSTCMRGYAGCGPALPSRSHRWRFRRQKGLCPGEQIIEVQIGSEELAVSFLIGSIHVQQDGIHLERRDGDEFLTVVVGRVTVRRSGFSSMAEPNPARVG